jgi:phage-related minor tail protein
MMPSRGMGDINSSKMPKAKTITRKDDPDKVEMFKGGGLYANIAAKKKRIAAGSGEKMRKVGAKGAPKKKDFANAAKTASFKEGGSILLTKSQRALENLKQERLLPRSCCRRASD